MSQLRQESFQDYGAKEGFALMKYASRDGSVVEWIWNSWTGTTPFGVRSRDGSVDLFHVDWRLDRRLPFYEPHDGERVFVQATEEILQEKVIEYVDKYWDPEDGPPTLPLRKMYRSKDEACERLLRSWMNSCSSVLVVWGEYCKIPYFREPVRPPKNPFAGQRFT